MISPDKEQRSTDLSMEGRGCLWGISLAFMVTVGMVVHTPDNQPVLIKTLDIATRPLASAIREGGNILRVSSAGQLLKSKMGLKVTPHMRHS